MAHTDLKNVRRTREYWHLHNICLKKSDEEYFGNIVTLAHPVLIFFIFVLLYLFADIKEKNNLTDLAFVSAIPICLFLYKWKYSVKNFYANQYKNLINMPDHKLELLIKEAPFSIGLEEYYVTKSEGENTTLFQEDFDKVNVDR
jgi:hypothetical protein